MAMAFVLISAELGHGDEVLKNLRVTPGVTEAHMVYGVYDIIIRIDAESMDVLKENIRDNIRSLDNIRSTLTMIVH